MSSNLQKFDNVDLAQKLLSDPAVIQATQEEQNRILSQLSELIKCQQKDAAWWWDKSNVKPFVLSYDQIPEQYINGFKLVFEESVLLAVTDDFAPPWPVFSGSLSHFLEVIGDSNYSEYVFISKSFEWAIFDNHHNALLFYGYIK
tara:strand:+ start:940 stop:1374 length:435 start_codon:yes stop_codon:yes gene_type:complete